MAETHQMRPNDVSMIRTFSDLPWPNDQPMSTLCTLCGNTKASHSARKGYCPLAYRNPYGFKCEEKGCPEERNVPRLPVGWSQSGESRFVEIKIASWCPKHSRAEETSNG